MNLNAKLDIQNLGKWLSSFKYLIAYVASIFLFSFVYWKNSCFLGLELNGFSEALYFSVVTITTLGFGDISPSGEFGQLLVAAQAFLGVLILGFFLNNLSHVRAEEIKANEQKIAEERMEKLRKGLELHACLIIGAFRSGSSFAWVAQAKYSDKMDELESFCKETYFYAFSKKNKIEKYQIKSLLEICHQNYETLLCLSPIAAEVSSDCLLEWSSLISSVRILSQEYEKVLSRTDDQNFPEWPSCEAIAMHIQSLINSTLIVSKREKLTSQCTDN